MDHRVRRIYSIMFLEDVTNCSCIDRKAYVEFYLEWVDGDANNALGEIIEYTRKEYTAIEKL